MKMKSINCIKKIIENLDYKLLNGKIVDSHINKLVYDSRIAEKDDLFVCLNGARFDSHSKINELIKKGVKVLVVEENNEYVKDVDFLDTIVLSVKDTRVALAIISSNYFGNPANKLKIIGVTGTKGKTTTSFMIKKILEVASHKVGLIGTVGIFIGNEHRYTDNTTPESYILHETFSEMVDQGIEYVVMEVSSQSLKYNRVYGIKFEYAIWTNIATEHIGENEHDSYEDYLNSKLKIFSMCKNAVVNKNTNNYNEVKKACENNNVHIFENVKKDKYNLQIPGDYNQENANLAGAFARAIGIDDDIIYKALEKVIVPGRCELVYSDDEMKIIVDFSYENNGAEKFLTTIREISHKRIVAIYGCGGNRSKDRRYGMGEVTGKLADFIILTADNSRYEKTIDIIKDIETTLKKYKKKNDVDDGYIIIEDRREAIEYAIKNHKAGDIICVMGKGHEPMMEMNGEKIRFLDREVILDIIQKLK